MSEFLERISTAEIREDELSFLCTTIGSGKLVVEIGSWAGRTSVALADRGNLVVAIDPFSYPDRKEDNVVLTDIYGTMSTSDAKALFLTRIKGKAILWLGYSSDTVFKRWRVPIDCVFVDGDHFSPHPQYDARWQIHVRPGGFIVFHDYIEENYPAVCLAVDSLRKKFPVVGQVGSLIIFQKR